VAELAELLEIEPLLDRSTHGLSGGEKQRVAIGRALSFRPTTLLLDEPLSALDEETRTQMCALLDHVRERSGVTTLHVTHNVEEAMRLSDQVLRIEEGGVRLRPVTRRHGMDDGPRDALRADFAIDTDMSPADASPPRHAK
jgi:ABC-type molybdate transport system ATPase subunit